MLEESRSVITCLLVFLELTLNDVFAAPPNVATASLSGIRLEVDNTNWRLPFVSVYL